MRVESEEQTLKQQLTALRKARLAEIRDELEALQARLSFEIVARPQIGPDGRITAFATVELREAPDETQGDAGRGGGGVSSVDSKAPAA